MSVKEQLKYMVNVNRQVTKSILEDVTEPESLIIVDKIPNHIRWITGHMVFSNGFALTQLGSEDMEWKKFGDKFGGGSKIAGDPSVYPSMPELRRTLDEQYSRELGLLENITADGLEKNVGEEEKPMPAWKRFTFMCMHDFYHCGQIVQIKRAIGRPRPFD